MSSRIYSDFDLLLNPILSTVINIAYIHYMCLIQKETLYSWISNYNSLKTHRITKESAVSSGLSNWFTNSTVFFNVHSTEGMEM